VEVAVAVLLVKVQAVLVLQDKVTMAVLVHQVLLDMLVVVEAVLAVLEVQELQLLEVLVV
jgi:hypothetical protein